MKASFERQIYDEVKHLFAEGELETLVVRPSFSDELPDNVESAVRLVHKSTNIEVTCSDFPSQIQNYIAAAIRLRRACDQAAAARRRQP